MSWATGLDLLYTSANVIIIMSVCHGFTLKHIAVYMLLLVDFSVVFSTLVQYKPKDMYSYN